MTPDEQLRRELHVKLAASGSTATDAQLARMIKAIRRMVARRPLVDDDLRAVVERHLGGPAFSDRVMGGDLSDLNELLRRIGGR